MIELLKGIDQLIAGYSFQFPLLLFVVFFHSAVFTITGSLPKPNVRYPSRLPNRSEAGRNTAFRIIIMFIDQLDLLPLLTICISWVSMTDHG